ncbi:ATP-binding cassette domain-containing protein [Mycoplasmopsis synoviae]|uniref:ATP-binding cassette domain-containing protein n=1 Tax=Mycoplasmopsis synoviae TaxID=2109 RepID=UPI001C58E7D7|nr:ATP-binding cassette domain-containing protein [Mycoplasmopsis synoviae]QXV99760.1 ATP-binding cassette domain-containing protein [Mycoplasmopsis synoviae]UBM43955.1 ATP-binding cassette domain-containing protein [Mycoplasmopsis synoviae]
MKAKVQENSKKILEISNLKKYFLNKNSVNKAVDNVSFSVSEGEIVGLIGESGSGKTSVARTITRFYENYNGFVTLDSKIISGNKISKKRLKHMRKNMQMIFQDPMASVNGQNNVYSILKEPLVVNGVIQEKVKRVLKSWKQVKKNYFYTFLELAKKLELEDKALINSLFEPFYTKWSNKFQELTDEDLNLEDLYNSFVAYLEGKNKIYSELINNLYSLSNQLIEKFEEKVKAFEEDKMDADKTMLKLALDNYNKEKKLNRKNKAYFASLDTLKNTFKEFKDSFTNKKETKAIGKSILDSLLSEVKNEAKLAKNSALSSANLKEYDFYIHLNQVYKFLYKLVKSNYAKLMYFDFETGKTFRDNLLNYATTYFVSKSSDSSSWTNEKFKKNFKFSLDEYLNNSQKNKKQIDKDFTQNVKTFKSSLKKTFKNFFLKPDKNPEKLAKAKKNYEEAQQNFDKELAKCIEKFELKIQRIKEKIKHQDSLSDSLKKVEKDLDSKFKELNAKYVELYKKQRILPLETKKNKTPSEARSLKNAKVELSAQESLVKERLKSSKAFNLEQKYLNIDIDNINLLLGISKLDVFIKKHPYLEALNWFLYPYKVLKIRALYIKSTIYKALEDVGLLKQFAYRYPHEFSGGQLQRIVIARALIINPKIIVADEPIASLDISIQAQIVNLLKDLCKKKNIGIIFIAHDLSMVEYIADKVQIMHLGKIVESGKTEKVYKSPLHPYTNTLFQSIPKISNANEKFQEISFDTKYLEEQKFPNATFLKEVEDNHYLFGTESQINKWSKKLKNVKKT